jgi:DNA-binding NarL/FixJ family response regulator
MDSDLPLTPREKEVLDLLRQGLGNKAIASRLGISLYTARRHASRVKRKAAVPASTALPFLGVAVDIETLRRLKVGSTELTGAEWRVLVKLCEGNSSKAIARDLQISPRTVDKHRENILRKCNLHSTRELSAWLSRQYAMCVMEKASEES